ncbi:DegT/DnrJ/EryC1/StrS family aminotransferase [Plantactinospora sp. DSM 117369]
MGTDDPVVIPHPPRWPVYDRAAADRAAELIRRGRSFDYDHGPEIAGLEAAFSRRHAGRYALTLNSGTSALLAAYFALGLGPGDEVIVPTFTFLATASPLFLLGAVPVLADSEGPDGTVSAASIERAVTPRTRAVAVTHLFGHPAPMDEITALCRRRGLALVEDCSHAHGSTYRGRPVGTFGDLAVFSVGGLKLVSGGMGGVLLARDSRHYDLACLLTAFKQRSERTVHDPRLRRLADVGLGGNLRISPPAAVLAQSHLDRIEELVAAKRANVHRLLEPLVAHPGLTGPVIAPHVTMGGWYDIVVTVDPERAGFSRDDLVAALRRQGVKADVPSTRPLHLSSIFTGAEPGHRRPYPPDVLARHFRHRRGDLPVAEALHDSWVSLPGPYFNDTAGALVEPYRAAIRAALDRLVPARPLVPAAATAVVPGTRAAAGGVR